MAENGRVHPDCVNAPNPYHECGVACLEKISQGQGKKEKKKSGSILETAWSFGRKNKESESQQNSPRAVKNAPAVKGAANNAPAVKGAANNAPAVKGAVNKAPAVNAVRRAPPSPMTLPTKKDEEPENSRSFSSSQQNSDESYSADHARDKVPVQSPGPMQMSGKITPDPLKSPSKISLACYKIPTPADPQNGEIHSSPKAAPYPSANHEGRVANGPITEYLNFSFSGISRASEGSDEEEARSVVSDSCVSVGKYHVRANVASILQLIFEKYGDIATGSRLESASMRAYYLECLCFVVQELQCTPFKQLTKSKIREMLAVLKDVESAQIDVSWLRDILNDLAEGMELSNQHQAAEEAKSNCDDLIESTKKELESMMEDLALKEKAVDDAKAQITETRTHLSKLELESSELGETISSIQSRVDKFHDKPLADEIL